MGQPQYLTGDSAGIKAFLDRFDVFLFDCDGVLWSGDHTFPRIRETLDMLRAHDKRLVFVTNNSTKSRAMYKTKFDSMGISVGVDEIFGSSYSAAIYIARILELPATAKPTVFVLGEAGIEDELDAEHVAHIGGTDPSLRRGIVGTDFGEIASGAALDDSVGCVLAGLDYNVSYLKLALAHAYLQRGALFLATNGDSTLPSAGSFFPGAGSCFAPLVKAVGREPEQMGKPSTRMMEAIEGKYKLESKERVCMVGDRLDTDIKFGIDGGLGGTLCVLSGVCKKEQFLGEGKEIIPTAYVDQLGDLMER